MTTSQPTGSVNLSLGVAGVKTQTDLVVSAGRQNERSFVASSLQSSSILPGVQTNASRPDFSTDRYTTTSSLSRTPEEILNVSAGAFARSEYKAPEPDEDGRVQVAGGYWDSKLGVFFRDQPNRLFEDDDNLSSGWYLLWDYVEESHPYLKREGTGPNEEYGDVAINVPILFYEGTDRIDAIVDSPESYPELDIIYGPYPDYDSYTVVYDTYVRYKAFSPTVRRVEGRFGTYAVQETLLYDEIGTPFTDARYGAIAGGDYRYPITSDRVTGTWEVDVKYPTTRYRFAQHRLELYTTEPAPGNPGTRLFYAEIRYTDFTNEGVYSLEFTCGNDQNIISRPAPPAGQWVRFSLTATETNIFLHQEGRLIASVPNPILSLSAGDSDASVHMGVATIEQGSDDDAQTGESAVIGPMRFTTDILYDNTDYEVGAII